MAPEVILVQNHGPPSDFFALGVIGYEFMLGFRPYIGRGRKEIKNLIIAKQTKINSEELPDEWSEESREFINLLLQRKPKKRLGYNGVDEIKQHSWMKDIDWDLLLQKKIEAPFIPPTYKENFDKKYCEGEDNIGETTIERYDLYYNSELYEGVFRNYTYINKNYVNDYYRNHNNNNSNNIKQQQLLDSNRNINNNKNFNTINNDRYHGKNNNNNEEIKLKKATIDYDSKLKLNQDKENKGDNFINNKNADGVNNLEKSGKKQYYRNNNNNQSSSSISNLNYKSNAPLVNENIICNNYINFNFNNYQNDINNNIKNKDPRSFNQNIIIENNRIDVSSLKQLLNNNESNDINIYNNNNEKDKENIFYEHNNNINSDNNRKKNSAKVIIPKSSSMKYVNNYPYNNNISNHFLSDNKKTTKIILIKNINNNENIINNNSILNNIKLQNNNFGLFKNAKMHRGLSDYNLKIDTNNLDLISIKAKFGKNSDKIISKNKGLNKATSYDTMNMGNNLKIKNTELDNKLSKWIQKNLKNKKNPKSLKINNQFSMLNMMNNNNKTKFILNLNNFNYINKYNYMKKTNKTNSMINILSDNSLKKDQKDYSLRNQNFPSINNISNNLNKKSFELNTNDINTGLRNNQNTIQKRSFNTINSAHLNSNVNKVQSLKNIHKPSINHNNPKFMNSNEKSPPISFNYFNFNNNKTRNKNKNNNLFNRNMNLNFGTAGKLKNKNYNLNRRINNFN